MKYCNLELSEEELKYLEKLLDMDLKMNGLGSLNKVVGLYNVLISARLEEKQTEKVE